MNPPLDVTLKADHLGGYTTEYRFAPPRRWRFDLAWPSDLVALEIEGGVWKFGRHNRGVGFERDIEKYNEAAVRGWIVIRATTTMLERDQNAVVAWIRRAIEHQRGGVCNSTHAP